MVLLLCCFLFYSYQTFTSAIYSRVSLESGTGDAWPVTLLCERAGFSRKKVAAAGLGARMASYLTWSMAPSRARPAAWENTRLDVI